MKGSCVYLCSLFLSFSGSFFRCARGPVWPWVSGWVGKSISIHLSTPLPTSSTTTQTLTARAVSNLQCTRWHFDLWQVLACDYRRPEEETDKATVQCCWVKCLKPLRKMNSDLYFSLSMKWFNKSKTCRFLIIIQRAINIYENHKSCSHDSLPFKFPLKMSY